MIMPIKKLKQKLVEESLTDPHLNVSIDPEIILTYTLDYISSIRMKEDIINMRARLFGYPYTIVTVYEKEPEENVQWIKVKFNGFGKPVFTENSLGYREIKEYCDRGNLINVRNEYAEAGSYATAG